MGNKVSKFLVFTDIPLVFISFHIFGPFESPLL